MSISTAEKDIKMCTLINLNVWEWYMINIWETTELLSNNH